MKRYGNNSSFIIDDIEFEMNPLTKFNCNGKMVSYAEYMSQNYQI